MVGRSVGQPATFHLSFSSGSTVLFRIQEPLYCYTLLEKMIFIHIIDSGILVLSISGIFTDSSTFFFFFGRPVNVKSEYFRWLLITTIDITINYFYCIIIVSQSSSLFILRSEGDWCVLALNISNIRIGFMEIMQLTSVASWLPGFLYIQVLRGIFQMNS